VVFRPDHAEFYLKNDAPRPKSDLSRERLLNFARNEIGAHFDREVSAEFSSLSHGFSPFQSRVESRDGKPSEAKGEPPHKWSYLSATLATIAFELMNSISFRADGKAEIITTGM
jgi:hypothetical protein